MGIEGSLHNQLEAVFKSDVAHICNAVSLPPNQFLTREQQSKRLELELQKQFSELKTKTSRGLAVCLKRLEETGDQANFVKESLRESLVPLQTKEAIQNYCALVAQGKTWKELLGISQEVMCALYKAAKSLLDAGRYQEAEDAFFYLLLVDHNCSIFWKGLCILQSLLNERVIL